MMPAGMQRWQQSLLSLPARGLQLPTDYGQWNMPKTAIGTNTQQANSVMIWKWRVFMVYIHNFHAPH